MKALTVIIIILFRKNFDFCLFNVFLGAYSVYFFTILCNSFGIIVYPGVAIIFPGHGIRKAVAVNT